jgi:bacterioferritin (cytochrome b1)
MEYSRVDYRSRIIGFARTAVTDEWLADYQYWAGASILSPDYEYVIAELRQHSNDEFQHATDIMNWIHSASPSDIPPPLPDIHNAVTYCGYTHPSSQDPMQIVSDNLDSELCAIRFYSETLDEIFEYPEENIFDIVEIFERIRKKEQEHSDDLRMLQEQLRQ